MTNLILKMDALQEKLKSMEDEAPSVFSKGLLSRGIARVRYALSLRRDVEQIPQTQSHVLEPDYQEYEYDDRMAVLNGIISDAGCLARNGDRRYMPEFCRAYGIKKRPFRNRKEFEKYLDSSFLELHFKFEEGVLRNAVTIGSIDDISSGDFIRFRFKGSDSPSWEYAKILGDSTPSSSQIFVNILLAPGQGDHRQFYFSRPGQIYNDFSHFEVQRVPEKAVAGRLVSYVAPPEIVGTYKGQAEFFGITN